MEEIISKLDKLINKEYYKWKDVKGSKELERIKEFKEKWVPITMNNGLDLDILLLMKYYRPDSYGLCLCFNVKEENNETEQEMANLRLEACKLLQTLWEECRVNDLMRDLD
jgi:hypothetical protein